MQLAERHIILDNRFEDVCSKSASLYNFVTYHYRQSLFGKQEYFSEYEMSSLCAEFNQEDYRSLPAQTSQQVIKQVFLSFKSWHRAKKEYSKNPHKFLGKPKLPKYKKGKKQNVVVFTNQTSKIKDGFIVFPKSTKIAPFPTKVDKGCFKQVRIVPQATCYVIEVVYEKEEISLGLSEENFLSLDLGINNYLTAISNVDSSFIINGRVIKSFNVWFNKRKAKYQSFVSNKSSNRIRKLVNYRNCWIEDKNHKISRFIVNYCIENNIGTIIIGKNPNWKNEVRMSKVTNQHFVNLPHSKLIDKIRYKASLVGIFVIEKEESYTSKCDSLALESVKRQESYLGKRKKRGMFQSSTGVLLNADVNGAINIARKVVGDSFVKMIADSGLVFNPRIITIV